MSQPVGVNFKSRIPTFADDASIQEAFSVYHYGVDNFTTQAIPDDSIEGHFRSLNARVEANENNISALGETFIEELSSALDPNIIRPENDNVVPLSIRGNSANQNADLQRWSAFDGNVQAKIIPGGAASFQSYISVGSINQSTTNAVDVNIGQTSHIGVIVRGVNGQTGDLQRWTKTDGITQSTVAKIDKDGKIFSNNGLTGTNTSEVVTLSGTQTLTNKTLTNGTVDGGNVDATVLKKGGVDAVTLTGLETLTNKTLTSPTLNTPTINNGTINADTLQVNSVSVVDLSSTQTLTNKTLTSPVLSTADINDPDIDGGTIDGVTQITLTGEQTLASFRVRNIYLSNTAPTNAQGSNGDIWIRYN